MIPLRERCQHAIKAIEGIYDLHRRSYIKSEEDFTDPKNAVVVDATLYKLLIVGESVGQISKPKAKTRNAFLLACQAEGIANHLSVIDIFDILYEFRNEWIHEHFRVDLSIVYNTTIDPSTLPYAFAILETLEPHFLH